MLQKLTVLVTFVGLTVVAAVARGETTAERLVAGGVELRMKGDHAGALRLFEQAHGLEPSALTFGQMGLAELSLKRWEDSEAHLGSALERRDAAWVQKNRAVLERALEAASAHVGELLIAGAPSGAEVYVNGRVRGALPLRAPVRASEGEAAVQITAAGHQPYVGKVLVPARGRARLDVTLEKQKLVEIAQKPRDAEKTGATGWSGRRVAGISLIGVGLLAGGGGGLLLRNRDDGCEDVPAGAMCPHAAQSKIPGFALIGVGAAAVVGGVVLLLGEDAAVTAAPGPRSFTISVRGRL